MHEALKLIRREHREVSLEGLLESRGTDVLQTRNVEPHVWVDRLDSLRGLSQRQQRLVWLHALGLTYAEIAAQESCTIRTVERQLLRAKRTVRAPTGAPRGS